MSLASNLVLALFAGAMPSPAEEIEPATKAPTGPVQDDEASAVNLVWDAPSAECSDAVTMQARLDEAMRLQLEDDPRTRQRWVIARVRQVDGAWTLRLWVAPEGGLSERALTETSCAELERATLTIVSMLMPPVMVELDPKPPPTAEDMTPPPPAGTMGEEELEAILGDAPEPEPPPPDPGGPDMTPPEPSKIRGAIGFAGGYADKNMPAGSGGLAITAAMVAPNARLELVGNYFGTRNIGLQAAPDARASYNMLSLAVRGCGAPAVNRWLEVLACGGIEAGAVIANLDGAELLHGPAQPTVLLTIESGLNVVVAPSVALKFAAQGWASLRRAEHQLLDSTLSRSGRFGYRVLAGVEFRFGGHRKARALER